MKCDPQCECMGHGHGRRPEDRRSCHTISFLLGLAVAGQQAEVAVMAYEAMMRLVTPVRGQAAN